MKHTYIKPLFIMILFGLSASSYAQTDTDTTTAEDNVEMPYLDVEMIEEAPEEDGAYEAVPDFDYNQDFSYEEPNPKKYDFQTRFGFGFVSLNNALSPVAAGSNTAGRFLPSTKFISSNISNF